MANQNITTGVVCKQLFPQMCRICLLTCESLAIIPSEIMNLYQNLTNIPISGRDELPQNICSVCLKTLEEVGTFIEKCKQNHALLTQALSATENPKSSSSGILSYYESFAVCEPLNSLENINVALITDYDESALISATCQNLENNCSTVNLDSDTVIEGFHLLKELETFNTGQDLPAENGGGGGGASRENQENARSGTQECNLCRKWIPKDELEIHVNEHLPALPPEGRRRVVERMTYTCEYCSKVFKKNYNLKMHLRIHTDDRPFECDICHQKFRQKEVLRRHIGYHITDKYFQCPKCGKLFSTKKALKAHIKRENFRCQHCEKLFTTNSTLEEHEMLHCRKKKPVKFECDICKKAFGDISVFKQHKKLHKGETCFSCEVCGKLFSGKDVLEKHMKVHDRGQELVCAICDKPHATVRDLKAHVWEVHAIEKPFVCEFCPKRFLRRSDMNVHRKKFHSQAPAADKNAETDASEKKDVPRLSGGG